jgi:hypothetical protein
MRGTHFSPEKTTSSNTQEQQRGKPSSVEASPSFEKLKKVMARIAQEINTEVHTRYGIKGLVNDTGHINTSYYSTEKGGIYAPEIIIEDQESVDALDRHNSSADNENVQKYYKVTTPEEVVAKHRETKEKSKSNQAEMIITALLHKVLKERFLVVRASVFDDYKNGTDNLILDKETGALICAFDEVLKNESDEGKAPVKMEKIKKKAMFGGGEAKYGISLQDRTLKRAQVRNIPVFYLTLESKDLMELTNDLYFGQTGTLSNAEERLFAHLVASIKEQKILLESLNLPPVMKKKLAHFETSLEVLESFTKKKS